MSSFHTKNAGALCSVPMILLVMIAALDSADKSLLAASFPILERTLHLNMAALGYFSLFTNLSYALSLPFWGWMVHHYTIHNAHNILSASCFVWGMATLGIAVTTGMMPQAVFRSINGAALASILPLSQTMLVELVPSSMRGRAFGLMGLMEKAASTLAVASVVGSEDWRMPYLAVGIMSVCMALAARKRLQIIPISRKDSDGDDFVREEENNMSLLQIIRRISRIPAFLCLVGQGVFGAIPWDMMSFLLLLLDWKGFSKDQIVMMQFSAGISGTIGGALGGILGDWFVQRHSLGRIAVAFVSVVGGIVFYGLFLFSNSYGWSFVWSNLFHVWGAWVPAAANRPLCADLARNPSERAQIVAAWILLEKTSAAVFGAPLVGYITKHMIDDKDDNVVPMEKAGTLAFNLFCLSSFFWVMCATFWLLMAYLMDVHERRQQPSYEMLDQTQGKSRV